MAVGPLYRGIQESAVEICWQTILDHVQQAPIEVPLGLFSPLPRIHPLDLPYSGPKGPTLPRGATTSCHLPLRTFGSSCRSPVLVPSRLVPSAPPAESPTGSFT